MPFFVKAPGQTEGRVDESLVRNIDVVATIADLLGSSVFYRQDGHSAFSDATRARREFRIRTRDFAQEVRIGLPGDGAPPRALEAALGAACSARGSRAASCTATRGRWPTGSGRTRSCSAGACHRSRWGAADGISAEVANASLVRHVTPGDTLFPTRVTGPLRGVPFGEHRDVAVAVNGRIRAVGRSFDLWWRGREYFSLMVPETSLRAGRNRVELFEVRAGRRLVPLQRR